MNICFFSQEYPPDTHLGGIGTYTYNMSTTLSRLGHSVHVITFTHNSEKTFLHEGVTVHQVKGYTIRPKEISQLHYSYSVNKKLSAIDVQFDVIHASEFAGDAFLFAFNKRFPLVTRLATPLFLVEELNGKIFPGPRPLLHWMEKKQTFLSDGVFTSTNALAQVVATRWKLDPSQIHIIPNSVNISRIIELSEKKQPPDILKHCDFLLYFGRLEERKGVPILARALPNIFARFPQMKVVFVGSDLGYRGLPLREYIRKCAGKWHKQIIFFDNLPHEELFPIVRLAKIVVLPSLWEAFGFVCIEAMALGRPVVATSGSGFEEIIEDRISGFLVEPGNSKILAQEIISVLQNEEGSCRVADSARIRAQDFEVSKIAPRVVAYYETIAQKSMETKGV